MPKTIPSYYLENESVFSPALANEEVLLPDDTPPFYTITHQTGHSELVITIYHFQEAKVIPLSMELDSKVPFDLKYLQLPLVEFSTFKELFRDAVLELL